MTETEEYELDMLDNILDRTKREALVIQEKVKEIQKSMKNLDKRI